MDKIKNILSGKKDEHVATSDHTTGPAAGHSSGLTSGTTTGNHAGFSGEGSHFDNTRDTVGSENTSGLTGQNTTGSGIGNTQNTGLSSGTATTTAGPHSSNLANKADPRIDSDLDGSRTVGNTSSTGTGYGTSTGNTISTGAGYGTGEADHHHGVRDAAIGAGGVRLAEHEHRKQEHQPGTVIGGTTGTTGVDQSTGAYGNTTGSTGHQSSHLGRDAALVGGGAGLAEHEHHKHSNERESRLGGATSQYTGAYDNNTGTATTGTGHQSHIGRNVELGAGGVGAVGVAEHEHHKHQQGVTSDLPGPAPNTSGPHKQDWLNKLDPRVNSNPDQLQSTGHGPLKVEEGHTGVAKPYDPTTGYVSNPHHHGVTDVNPDGSTTRHANPTHHGQTRANDLPGHDASAVGALGGAGAYEAGKHHYGTESGIGGTSSTTGTGDQHHLGRDAGVAAGGAGLAEHEHRKHEGVTGSQYDNTSSDLTGSGQGRSHLGRDTAGVGAAGLVREHEHRKHEGLTSGRQYDNTISTSSGLGPNQGLGGNEYRKDDLTTGQQSAFGGQQSGLTGSGYDSNVTASNTTGGIGGDRNRLRKDAPLPSDYPAAQRGVPVNGTERERLDQDTGVSKSYAQGGVNAASNY